ncbi:chemotaxis protein CheW [Myxosarcina sp. GI1]|uniref:chemotaxis protein CheW n=1 Tax=Myxosarcina sp. GI1 TaxID=1541065 RepID=UPI00055D2A53|nr:chemotaxis protein CheW [Myxosarcina sp. GI1]
MVDSLDLSLEIKPLENPEGELHLRFFLPSGVEFALPATSIAEVLQQTPDSIAPIPNASPILLGAINLRGKVVWVADLGQFLGDSGELNTDRPTIPVIAVEYQNLVLGLAIEKIGDMDWLDVEKLQMYSSPPENMAPFISAQWQVDRESDRVLNLLETSEIFQASRWATRAMAI